MRAASWKGHSGHEANRQAFWYILFLDCFSSRKTGLGDDCPIRNSLGLTFKLSYQKYAWFPTICKWRTEDRTFWLAQGSAICIVLPDCLLHALFWVFHDLQVTLTCSINLSSLNSYLKTSHTGMGSISTVVTQHQAGVARKKIWTHGQIFLTCWYWNLASSWKTFPDC